MKKHIKTTENIEKSDEDFDKFFSENPEILKKIKSFKSMENSFDKLKETLIRSKNLNFDYSNISENDINAEMMLEIDNYYSGLFDKVSKFSGEENFEVMLNKYVESNKLVSLSINEWQYVNPILKRAVDYFKARSESFESFIQTYIKRINDVDNKPVKTSKIQLELNKSQIAYLIIKMEEKGLFKKHNNPNYLKIFSEFFKTKDNQALTNDDLSKAIYNFQNTKKGVPKSIQNIDDFIDIL